MIYSARLTVSPVVNIVFTWICFVLLDFEKRERTGRQYVWKQLSLPAVTVGWPSGSIDRGTYTLYQFLYPLHKFQFSSHREKMHFFKTKIYSLAVGR